MMAHFERYKWSRVRIDVLMGEIMDRCGKGIYLTTGPLSPPKKNLVSRKYFPTKEKIGLIVKIK